MTGHKNEAIRSYSDLRMMKAMFEVSKIQTIVEKLLFADYFTVLYLVIFTNFIVTGCESVKPQS